MRIAIFAFFFPFPLLCMFMTPTHVKLYHLSRHHSGRTNLSILPENIFIFFKGLQEAIVPLAPAMCVCPQSFFLSWCCSCHVFVVKAGLWFVMMAGHGQGYDRIREKVCERLAVVILSMRKVCDDLQKRKPVYFFILERGDTLVISGAFVMTASWWEAHLSDLFLQLSLA